MTRYLSKAQSFNRNFIFPVKYLSEKLIEKNHHKYVKNVTIIGSTANAMLLNTFVGGSVLYGVLNTLPPFCLLKGTGLVIGTAFSIAFTASFIIGIAFSVAFVRKHKVYQSNEDYLITSRSSEFAKSMIQTSITGVLINSGGIALDKLSNAYQKYCDKY